MEHEPKFVYISKGRNPVTVCGFRDPADNEIVIGVARYGANSKKERKLYPFDKELGISICSNRAKIQPYCKIPNCHTRTFNVVAKSITSHIENCKQWEHQSERVGKIFENVD